MNQRLLNITMSSGQIGENETSFYSNDPEELKFVESFLPAEHKRTTLDFKDDIKRLFFATTSLFPIDRLSIYSNDMLSSKRFEFFDFDWSPNDFFGKRKQVLTMSKRLAEQVRDSGCKVVVHVFRDGVEDSKRGSEAGSKGGSERGSKGCSERGSEMDSEGGGMITFGSQGEPIRISRCWALYPPA